MDKDTSHKIGLGITTYNRPDYFRRTIHAVIERLKDKIDTLVVFNDGSNVPYSYPKEIDIVFNEAENKGVAHAKNTLLKTMILNGCDYLFILEDDVFPTSERAIDGYIELHKETGLHHFNFAHHGPANTGGPLQVDDNLALYPHCIGAFSFYTRECIEKVGYMDEQFKNAFEHIEHTKRITDSGMTTPFWYFVDHKDSGSWLQEIEGSIDNSSIRPRPDWKENIEKALVYWKQKDGTGLPSKPY